MMCARANKPHHKMHEKKVSFLADDDDDDDEVYMAPIKKRKQKRKRSWFKWFIDTCICCVN